MARMSFAAKAGVSKLSQLGSLTWDSWLSLAAMATALNDKAVSEGVIFAAGDTYITTAGVALIFDHTNLTAAKGASIFELMTTARDASIFELMTATKANSICDSANLTSDKEQAILYQMITDDAFAELIDIIVDGQAETTISTNTAISDTNIYKTLTVNNGITLTVNTSSDSKSGIIIAGTITSNGTITRTAQGAAGGTAGVAGAGAGVKGGAGLLIIVKTLDNNSIISAPGLVGNNGTTIAASGFGGHGSNGSMYRVSTNTVGTGGDGARRTLGCIALGTGGAGSGGGGNNPNSGCGGNGGSVTYTTLTGAEIHDLLMKATVDYFIQTVEGKSAPSSPQAFIDIYGSGSGGGGGQNDESACGGGGGCPGEVIIACDTYDNTGGTISADAGNGGNGGTEGTDDGGAGGGGGGLVYVLYKTQTAAGTLSVALGAAGTGDYNGTAGAVGTTSAIDVTA